MNELGNLVELLSKHKGNKMAVAKELGISRGKLWRKLKKYSKTCDVSKTDSLPNYREIRALEAQISSLKESLKKERERREVAEADIMEILSRDDVLKGVQEREVAARELSNLAPRNLDGCTAVIAACDWHLEEQIIPSLVGDLNEFNLSIAAKRIDRLWEKSVYLIDFFRNIANVNEVILWLGGDLINGYLHEECMESNFCGPTEAISLVQDHIATGINHIQKSIKDVQLRVVCNYGNHGRTTKKMHVSTGWKTSWEWLAYVTLSKIFTGIPWQIADGYFNHVDTQGFNIRFHHGESVKYQGGIGGLTIPMNKAVQSWDKARRADYSINGHYHTYMDNWTWVSCGCLCGYDPFAQSIKADFQDPTQTIIFIDRSRGKVLSCPIFVEKPRLSS